MSAKNTSMPVMPRAENAVSDREIFEALDPDWPGLERVIHAYRLDHMEEAKRELMVYFQRRQSPEWFFDYRGQPVTPINPNENRFMWGDSKTSNEDFIRSMMKDADHLCEHRFQGAFLYDLGERWDRLPLFDLNQQDNKPLRVTANRFVRMNFLNSLAIAYHQSGDNRYSETFVQLLESFLEGLLEQNPYVPDPLESLEAYTIQFSKNPFRSNMSVARSAFNIINLMYTELFYSEGIPVKLSFRLFRYAWYVMLHHRSYDRNNYRYHNHHLFERGVAPLIFGIMFPEFPQFRPLLQRGKEVIQEHLEKDFFASGGYDEHSLGYTCETTLTEFLVPVKVLTSRNNVEGLDCEWLEALQRVYSYYSALVLPDGTFPDIGDNGGGNARLILEHGCSLYRNKTASAVLKALGMADESDPDMPALDEHWASSLPPLTMNDPLAGYLVARDDWTTSASCMVLSNKEYSRHCAHNHADMLSLLIAVRGETLIGEPQASILYKYVSNESALDDYMRGLGSHNSVLVCSEPITKAYLRSRSGLEAQHVITEEMEERNDRIYVRASHKAYTNVKHTREVLFMRRQGWWIADTIEMSDYGAAQEILQEDRLYKPHIQRWHLEHAVEVETAGTNALVLSGKKARLLCVWPEEQQIAFDFWKNEAALELEGLAAYKNASDLPWIIDVRFHAGNKEGTDRIQCLFVDITYETSVPKRLDRCREMLKGNRFPSDEQFD